MLHVDDGRILSNSIRNVTKGYTLWANFHCEPCGLPSEFFGSDIGTATLDNKL